VAQTDPRRRPASKAWRTGDRRGDAVVERARQRHLTARRRCQERERCELGLRKGASKPSISSRTRARMSSRRAMISPTRSAISCPAPDPTRCDVLPRVSIARDPTIMSKAPTDSKSEPQTGHRSPMGSGLSQPRRRVRHAGIRMQHRAGLLVVRRVRYAWLGSLGPCGSASVRVPSAGWVFRRRLALIAVESRRDPRSRVNSLRPARCRIVLCLRHSRQAFPSLSWGRTEE
jgi:hypothetical protein